MDTQSLKSESLDATIVSNEAKPYAMPTEGFIQLKNILKMIPMTRQTWYNGMKQGIFPKPIKYGRLSLWKVEDIRALIANFGNIKPESRPGFLA